MKNTALSWAAKYGLSLETRKLLGHHALGNDTVALGYSRDAQAAPVAEYQKVLDSIRVGSFDPDASRSGRFKSFDIPPTVHEPPATAAFIPFETPVVELDIAASETPHVVEELFDPIDEPITAAEPVIVQAEEYEALSHSGSDAESSSHESSAGEDVISLIRNIPKPAMSLPSDCVVYVHNLSCLLHLALADGSHKLHCGRPVSSGYTRLQQEPHRFAAKCVQCFAKYADAAAPN